MESLDRRVTELYSSDTEVFGVQEMEDFVFESMDNFSPSLDSLFLKTQSEGAYSPAATSTLASLESTISAIGSKKSLMRNRDLMSLLCSYPVAELRNLTSESNDETQLPPRLKGLIPMEIINAAENGDAYLEWIPGDILHLAADLAVQQLIHILGSTSKYQHDHVRHTKYIRLTTRSDIEKRAVKEKIEAALNDKNLVLHILNFHGTLSIDASRYPTTRGESQLQKHVCQLLELSVIEDDNISCTRLIEEEMSSNKYLVLLVDRDGDEEIVDLQEVGFFKTLLSGTLVLVTSESTEEPHDKMGELVDLEIRTKDHLLPWLVFCHNVGKEFVYSSTAILTTAVRIVEECRDHLHAIVLVAKWLKNFAHVRIWELALHKLQCANPSHDIPKSPGLNSVMINTFQNLIWDGINQAQKNCLLTCLFVPEIMNGMLDYELKTYWMSSLFMDAGHAAHNLTQLLENSVLLQFDDIKGRHVWLTGETYTMLRCLYSSCPLFIDKSGLGLTELSNTDQWCNAVRIELADNKISVLSLSPDCLDVRVLMLQHNVELTKIPSSFFYQMPLLCVLNLSYTSIRELPHSLFFLEQLRELYLKGCQCFMKLPPEIGNLQKLEKLDLDETQITHLPNEVQKLTNIQSLTLYFYEYRGNKNMQYSCSTIIPSGVLSKLERLKHLSIGVNPDDGRWHENVQVILPEILGLVCLQYLSIYIPELELLKLIPPRIFGVDFRFIVGCHKQRIISSIPPAIDVKFKQCQSSLKFVKGQGVSHEIKLLLRHSKALFLDRHCTLKSLSEFEINLQQLQLCILAECKEMETICGGGYKKDNDDMLSRLLFLNIIHMKNLRSIWEGPTPPRGLFGMLQSLSLQGCPKLTTLFSLDLLGNLSLLKELMVKDCSKLSTLVIHESCKLNVGPLLPLLRKLWLLHLPELTSISSGLSFGPCLREIGCYGCPKLRILSRKELISIQLMVIKGEANWWKALEYRPFEFDLIFSPIHQEADVMDQLRTHNHDNIDNSAGSSVSKPSQPTGIATCVSNSATRRGFYNRRRSIEISEKRTSYPTDDDGYTWRKYGQKEELNSKYPREYYRCSRRYDQGCWATKQVQRIGEDPPLYRTTYKGHHTCLVNVRLCL